MLTVTFRCCHRCCLGLFALCVHTFPSSPVLTSQDLAYFLWLKVLCLCFWFFASSLVLCAGFLTALANTFSFSVLCALLFPIPFCCLPGFLFCSCPSCLISRPGGMCWRSRLCTTKLLVVFHNIEVSLSRSWQMRLFSHRTAVSSCQHASHHFCFTRQIKELHPSVSKGRALYRASGRVWLLTCVNNWFSCVGSWVPSVKYLVYLIWLEKNTVCGHQCAQSGLKM